MNATIDRLKFTEAMPELIPDNWRPKAYRKKPLSLSNRQFQGEAITGLVVYSNRDWEVWKDGTMLHPQRQYVITGSELELGNVYHDMIRKGWVNVGQFESAYSVACYVCRELGYIV